MGTEEFFAGLSHTFLNIFLFLFFMVKAIILDIDGVAFPIKKQFSKFLISDENKEILGEEFIYSFIKSNFAYIRDFLRYDSRKERPQFENYEQYVKKTINKKIPKVLDTFEENLTIYLLRQFGDTDYFIEGYEPMIKAMNFHFKLRHIYEQEEVKIIGATSRGHTAKPDWIYNNCFERTNEWNKKHGSLIDKIYFKEHGKKITVLEDIKNDFGIGKKDILCMVEDSAYELEDFLKRGIAGVFINEDKIYNAETKKELHQKYPHIFNIAQTHTHAKDKVINLYSLAA